MNGDEEVNYQELFAQFDLSHKELSKNIKRAIMKKKIYFIQNLLTDMANSPPKAFS